MIQTKGATSQMDQVISKELAKFLENSPSVFHAVDNMENILTREKFTRLYENQRWALSPGGRYFVARNGSSLIAFTIPDHDFKGLRCRRNSFLPPR